MAKQYDLVVIGTGSAAMTAAMRIRAAGWTVAVIDFRPFGGTCALRGCDPKKVLVTGAEVVAAVRNMRGRGIAGDARIRWDELMAFKRSFTAPVPERRERAYAERGIDAFHGRAQFTGGNSLDVGGTAIEARHFLIAAGAEPVRLGIPGEEHLRTHEDFLALERLPGRLVLVGGGYIAAEFSHIAARAGASVTVLQRGARMLPQFDPDLVDGLMERSRAIGIDIHTDTAVRAVEKTSVGFRVHAVSQRGSETFVADVAIHAAGRAPALEGLRLDTAGVAMEQGRLKLNQFLQSATNPAVYAAGDSARRGPPLTPISGHDGRIAAANLLEGNRHTPDYRGVPSVAFTVPPVAAVGLSEAEAREQGLKFRAKLGKAADWYTARRLGESLYAHKILIEEAESAFSAPISSGRTPTKSSTSSRSPFATASQRPT